MDRLPPTLTSRIESDKKINFIWQGRPISGLAGDTVATALFASGVRIFSRSLKYHRPRGLYSLDGESANTLVNIDGECNAGAEQVLIRQGMRVTAQNYKGSLEKDWLGFIDAFDRLMPAGFYYHWFHKPYRLWPWFSNQIRQMAGTGQVDYAKNWNSYRFHELYPQAEICILGGGPSGMSAALAAAESGLRVVLIEARPWLGGFYDWQARIVEGQKLHQRALKLATDVQSTTNIQVFKHTQVVDVCGDNLVTAIQNGGPDEAYDQRYIQIRCRAVVIATGCRERPSIFEHNERPGVMQPSCAWRLARTYRVMPGKKAVFSVGDDLGLEAALDLANHGLEILAVADTRHSGQRSDLTAEIKAHGITFLPGWTAIRTRGTHQIDHVTLSSLQDRKTKYIACDLLAASAGASPVIGPLATVGAKLTFDQHTGFFLPSQLPDAVHVAGRVLGLTDSLSIETSGQLAGLMAANSAGVAMDTDSVSKKLSDLPGPATGSLMVNGDSIGRGRKAFICFDEDGTYKAAVQAADRGFNRPELAKRYGGFGLGPGQYGIPGHNLPLILNKITGSESSNMAPSTIRPPLSPVLMATLAGPEHNLHKLTPMHRSQEVQGAIFQRLGIWKRARCFGREENIASEVKAVRNKVGLMDISTLGKFKIYGPDALKILQRVYISDMSRTRAGKLTYSAMLNAEGMLMDDGVVTRVGEEEYYFTTSTARAGFTAEWLRYHSRYENWKYYLVNLTDHLAAVNLAGPQSRDVLSKLTDFDLSSTNFPYAQYREFKLKDQIPVKALRVGFVGELSYELHFPACYGPTVWTWLMEAGQTFNIRPFGLEAQNICRLEKGHVIAGLESEQRVNLLDLGMGLLWAKDDTASGKVGAPALRFTQDQPDRLKFVGFEIDVDQGIPDDGALVYQENTIEGFVCTCRFSSNLGRVIGLALVKEGLIKQGTLNVYQNFRNNVQRFQARVAKTPFYDPKGLKVKC